MLKATLPGHYIRQFIIFYEEPWSLYCDASRLGSSSMVYFTDVDRRAGTNATACCNPVIELVQSRLYGTSANEQRVFFFHRRCIYFCINNNDIAKITLSHRRPTHDVRVHL